MKRFISISLLATLIACGSEAPKEPEQAPPGPANPPPNDPPPDPFFTVAVQGTDACAPDASTDASDAASDAGVDSGPEECAPRIGHCLTGMATLCYETSFDDTTACAASGLSSGWRAGPCEVGARSSGGCVVGCNLSYRYPLGGGDATEATRGFVKDACEEAGGVYVDTRTYEGDSGTL